MPKLSFKSVNTVWAVEAQFQNRLGTLGLLIFSVRGTAETALKQCCGCAFPLSLVVS